jgi:4-hydroxy-2-oxovalerate aldolase
MKIRITDVTLRDGSHPVFHQFTRDQIVRVSKALDEAGVPVIEVTHGDGLAGSSIQYGFSLTDELALIEAAVETVKQAKIAVLLLPGIGTIHDLKEARKRGASLARIATHCTEADISAQHIAAAKELGMEVVGFLMMSHMLEPDKLAEQAKLMESYGADIVYVVDSAGAQTMDMVRDRVTALRGTLDAKTHVGFHAHNNLGLGVGNSVTAALAGADHIDGACRGLGAGAGNAATEAVVAVFNKMGIETGINLYGVMDIAEDIVAGELGITPSVNRPSLVLGYAGVYSSFLRHAENASKRFGVPAYKILEAVGKRKAVGGQEDLIVECAIELAAENAAGETAPASEPVREVAAVS